MVDLNDFLSLGFFFFPFWEITSKVSTRSDYVARTGHAGQWESHGSPKSTLEKSFGAVGWV